MMASRSNFSRPRANRGQALTELAVATAVLVPLFLLIPLAAKYAHARQMTQQAARNAVWEATVARDHRLASASNVQARMLDRSFALADAQIRSQTTGRTTGQFGDLMLNTFSGKKLLERDNVRVTRYSERTAPGFVSSIVGRFPTALPGDFPPNNRGYVTGEVQLRLRDLKTADGRAASFLSPVDRLNLVMTGRQTLLADAWGASGPTAGPRSVRSQVKSLVPTSALAPLSDVFDVIGALPLPILGKLDSLDIGTIEPDIVPYDKLQRYPARGP